MCCIYLNLIKICPKINLWQIYKGVEMRTNGYTTRIINVFEYLCDSCVHHYHWIRKYSQVLSSVSVLDSCFGWIKKDNRCLIYCKLFCSISQIFCFFLKLILCTIGPVVEPEETEDTESVMSEGSSLSSVKSIKEKDGAAAEGETPKEGAGKAEEGGAEATQDGAGAKQEEGAKEGEAAASEGGVVPADEVKQDADVTAVGEGSKDEGGAAPEGEVKKEGGEAESKAEGEAESKVEGGEESKVEGGEESKVEGVEESKVERGESKVEGGEEVVKDEAKEGEEVKKEDGETKAEGQSQEVKEKEEKKDEEKTDGEKDGAQEKKDAEQAEVADAPKEDAEVAKEGGDGQTSGRKNRGDGRTETSGRERKRRCKSRQGEPPKEEDKPQAAAEQGGDGVVMATEAIPEIGVAGEQEKEAEVNALLDVQSAVAFSLS